MFSFSWPLLLQPTMASENIIWYQPYESEVIKGHSSDLCHTISAYINNGLLGMNIFKTTEQIIVFLIHVFITGILLHEIWFNSRYVSNQKIKYINGLI